METILYKNDRIVLWAQYADPQLHKHFAKHIIVSDSPFVCLTEHQQYTVSSIMIQSQTLHSIRTEENSKIAVFLIDETSALSRQINQMYLRESRLSSLPAALESEIIQRINLGCSLEEIDGCIRSHFPKDLDTNACMDVRIASALQYIEESETLDQEIYNALPRRSCLSKSRFLHLFKENMGIDMKNYLRIKRMEKTYDYVINRRMCITEAAILSGFSSSSHFSEACRQHYGISLTEFLKAQK